MPQQVAERPRHGTIHGSIHGILVSNGQGDKLVSSTSKEGSQKLMLATSIRLADYLFGCIEERESLDSEGGEWPITHLVTICLKADVLAFSYHLNEHIILSIVLQHEFRGEDQWNGLRWQVEKFLWHLAMTLHFFCCGKGSTHVSIAALMKKKDFIEMILDLAIVRRSPIASCLLDWSNLGGKSDEFRLFKD